MKLSLIERHGKIYDAESGAFIARIGGSILWDDFQQAISDLFVAAPELLEALVPFAYLAQVMEEGNVLNFRGVYITYEQAQAAAVATAKAKGETE